VAVNGSIVYMAPTHLLADGLVTDPLFSSIVHLHASPYLENTHERDAMTVMLSPIKIIVRYKRTGIPDVQLKTLISSLISIIAYSIFQGHSQIEQLKTILVNSIC